MLICLNGSINLAAQEIRVEKEALKIVLAKAEKYELVLGENGALKVRLASIEDTLNARNEAMLAKQKTIEALSSEVRQLKIFRMILLIICGVSVGFILWRFAGNFKFF